MSGTAQPLTPEGITNPPIDDLLDRTQSKYALVIVAAKRARQINAYYSQIGEGLLEYVGPLVETAPQEKALSIALREINADLIDFRPSAEPVEGEEFAADAPAVDAFGTPSLEIVSVETDDGDADPFADTDTPA
ncbi:MAG: DNA-directed polymerase subunit omega [Jatrophihabitantaceae bacterium]|nr:DNA-directed polymerase subunit omega [Jatrophihabitantaceae bacterium]